jgi:hypothetical protein
MKRDMELIRKLLLEVEERDYVVVPNKRGQKYELIVHHLLLLCEAQLIAGIVVIECDGGQLVCQIVSKPRLTWAGHEFLDAARDDSIWKQAKKIIAPLGGVPIAVATAILTDLVKEKLGLPR